jgi:hypothetical protein
MGIEDKVGAGYPLIVIRGNKRAFNETTKTKVQHVWHDRVGLNRCRSSLTMRLLYRNEIFYRGLVSMYYGIINHLMPRNLRLLLLMLRNLAK